MSDGRGKHSYTSLYRDNQLVSDLIGFTLMFGIIIVSVGIVSLGGFDGLAGFGDRQEIATAERGMQAGSATLENVNRQGDATRNFDLTIGTGNVWVNETAMEFSANNGAADDIGEDGELSILSLEHRFDRQPEDITVNYEGGGVFRSDFIIPRSGPPVTCAADDVAVLSIANLTVPDDADIDVAVDFNRELIISPTDLPEESPVAAFAQSVTIDATLVDTELHRFENGDGLEINVSATSNPTAWVNAMEDAGWSGDADALECNAEEILVQISTIEITDD